MTRDQRITSFLYGVLTAALWIFLVDYTPARTPDWDPPTDRAAAVEALAPEWTPVRATADERALAHRPVAAVGGQDHNARLFRAIRQVESGGRDDAIGDGGRSVGPYQCGLAAFLDGGGKAADWPRLAYDRAATEAVMLAYWTRYGAVTDEQKARIWNGGPNGMRKAATLPYWAKVRRELER